MRSRSEASARAADGHSARGPPTGEPRAAPRRGSAPPPPGRRPGWPAARRSRRSATASGSLRSATASSWTSTRIASGATRAVTPMASCRPAAALMVSRSCSAQRATASIRSTSRRRRARAPTSVGAVQPKTAPATAADRPAGDRVHDDRRCRAPAPTRRLRCSTSAPRAGARGARLAGRDSPDSRARPAARPRPATAPSSAGDERRSRPHRPPEHGGVQPVGHQAIAGCAR